MQNARSSSAARFNANSQNRPQSAASSSQRQSQRFDRNTNQSGHGRSSSPQNVRSAPPQQASNARAGHHSQPQSTPQSGQDKPYFDLHVDGIGYLSRVREVQPKRGDPFLCCAISALRGSRDNAEYTYFDLRVSGGIARERIEALWADANDRNTKVLVKFRIGDFYPEAYTLTKGDHAGQQRIALKGRLLKLLWAKVNGEDVELPGVYESELQGQGQGSGDDGGFEEGCGEPGWHEGDGQDDGATD